MTKGYAGADSASLVSSQIDGKTLVDLATKTLGAKPVFWGRYFTSVSASGDAEYRHLEEGQLLRENNIRVLPIARQTERVAGTSDEGVADAKLNAEDVIKTFGADYLKSLGGSFLMFLDVESTPSLSLSYYTGWAQTLSAYSQTYSNGAVTLLPCVYGTQSDGTTWQAIASASSQGVPCHGVWIAHWTGHGCNPLPDWSNAEVAPKVSLPCSILLWQYSDDCHGGNGFDCNQTNPAIDFNGFIGQLILPPEVVAATS
jgi:hypothetical protein